MLLRDINFFVLQAIFIIKLNLWSYLILFGVFWQVSTFGLGLVTWSRKCFNNDMQFDSKSKLFRTNQFPVTCAVGRSLR